MKFNRKGIRFSTWLYFLGFSLSLLFILGFLLIVLIKPYYRNDRLKIIDSISDSIGALLSKETVNAQDIEHTTKMVAGNNVCTIIYNENGKEIYSLDSLGELCMLDKKISINDTAYIISNNPIQFINMLKENTPFSLTLNSDVTNTEMILYAKQFKNNLANYYLIINTPLELVEAYINFILNQYLYVTIFVVLFALVVAFFLAKRISMPIVKMKDEAMKLAEGNYDVKFESNSFSEINDLAITLDDATEKLSQINDLRKDLIANVSHDIKTPLTIIQTYAEMIRDISGDDKQKRDEHLQVILNETTYLNKLVTDMSELSKLQAQVIKINLDNFDLCECTNEVIDLLLQVANEKNIKIITKMDDCFVYADKVKISQVIYNFISNAIKHSNNDSTIKVNIIDSEDKVRLEVIDYGEGISEESLPYIWDRYYKVDKNFNRNSNSTGLGLAIAKAILEAHNAKFGVTSKEKQGSTFYFELSKDYENDEE